MKKTIFYFLLSATVIVGIVVWGINADFSGSLRELLMVGAAIILVGFAVYIGIQRVQSHRRKENTEDELSRKIMLKSSSLSYYISLYLWLFIGYMSDYSTMETHTLIGTGIIGMAIIFFLSWLLVRINVIKHE